MINFLTVAKGPHTQFIIPFITSCLTHHPDGYVEIYKERDFELDPEVAKLLELAFPNRWSLQNIPAELLHLNGNSTRFLLIPKVYRTYTYIADIDIPICENIRKQHAGRIESMKLCFDNFIRKGTRRLTGCHFATTWPWYRHVAQIRDKMLREQAGELSDEQLLYALAEKGWPKFAEVAGLWNIEERNLHGIHFSLNRKPFAEGKIPGWGITPEKYEALSRLRETGLWKQLTPYMNGFNFLLKQLDVAAGKMGIV